MSRKVSIPAVALLMVGIAVLSATVHFVRGYQIRRNAQVFLEQADRARDANEPAKELRLLQSYLGLVPGDGEVRGRYALLLDQFARSRREQERAFYALDAALRLSPERVDLRRKAIQAALRLNRPSDALFHLKALSEQEGETAETLETMGDIERQRGDYAKAEQLYARSTAKDATRVNAFVARAALLRTRLNRSADADRCIQDMIQANQGNPQAEMARISYTRETRGLGKQTDEFRKILADLIERHGSAIPELYLLAATLEREDDKPEVARQILLKGQKAHPEQVMFPRELARLDLLAGRRKEALATLRGLIDKLPPRGNEFWMTIELLLEAGEKEEVDKLIGKIRRDEDTSTLVDFFEGRAALACEDWLEAIRLLDRARQDRNLSPEILQSAHLSVGRAQQQLNNPDRHLEATDAALQIDPLWLPALISKAEALSSLGRLGEALTIYETILGRWPPGRIAAAQLWIARNLSIQEDQRNWDRPLALLREAPESVRTSPQAVVLEARLLTATNKRAEAEKLLEQACAKQPREVTLWLGLADVVDDGQQGDRVDAVLDRAEKAVGDGIELRLARAQLLARRNNLPASKAVLDSAEKAAQNKTGNQQRTWLRLLGRYLVQRGDMQDADRIFTRLTTADNRNLSDWATLLDIKLARDQRDQLEPILKRLEELEGPEGTLWRYGRAIQYAGTGTGNRQDLARAREWLAEIRKRRPGWSRPYFLDGQLAEVEGDTEAAVQQYRAAIERGESGVEVVRRLVQLLNRQRNYNEAQAVLARFRDLARNSRELTRLATLTQFQAGENRQNVLEQARKNLPEDSTDYRDHLLRGQLLWATRYRNEAEKAFRRAVELAPQEPECTIVLVSFLQERNPQKAREEIEAASRRLPATVAPLALAACYEVVGSVDKAEEQYAKAAKLRPDDAAVLRAQALFFLRRGQLARAEPVFRKLIALPGSANQLTAAWARRTLALAMAATGDYERYREALKLLDENAAGKRPSADDQRARALILARQPRDRREAIRNLEASFARVPPTPEEEFFLATLLVANREWQRARERLVRLLTTTDNPNPAFLVYFLEQLIQNDELAQTEPWIARLEKLEPDSVRTAVIKARLLQARKDDQGALQLLRAVIPAVSKDATQMQSLARVLESLGFKEEAESLYRRLADNFKDSNPRAVLPLVAFLGRTNRIGEALQLCAPLRDKIPDTLLAEITIGVLRDGKPTPEQIQLVADWMKAAKEKNPQDSTFDLALANILDLRGQTAEAIASYRELLQRDPRNVLAYNNLAVLLALGENKFDEALASINKAIELVGPLPNLLDTRGILYLSLRQSDLAITDLEEATQMTPDPASLFRLACAYLLARDRRNAQSVWAKARNARFNLSQLHPLERPAAEKALAELGTPVK